MSIKKIVAKGKTKYKVFYRDIDSRSYKSKVFDKKADAEDFEAALTLAKPGGVRVKRASNQRLDAFWAEVRDRYGADYQATTLGVQDSVWRKWINPQLGHVGLHTLSNNPELVQDFKVHMQSAGAGNAITRMSLMVLSGVMSKAVELNRVATNPVSGVRKPPAKRNLLVTPLPAATVEALIAHVPKESDKRLIALLAYAGLRPGEALALDASDIGQKSIKVTKALKMDGEGPTKTGAKRVVPITAQLLPYLIALPNGPLFTTREGAWTTTTSRNWRRRVWQPACQAVGIGKLTIVKDEATGKTSSTYVGPRLYDLRHTAASTWLYKRVDPIRVASWMGHSPAVLLETYAHVIEELPEELPEDA